jgi:hypothetical protein
MRQLVTTEGTHQTKADVTRLYIKRPTGGNGLVQLESIYDDALIGLSEYIEQGKERLTRLLQEYTRKNKYSPQKEADLIKQKYMTQETAAQNIKYQLKSSTEKEKTEELGRKPMHGQFYRDNERPSSVDKEKSKVWLCCSRLKGEIENLIIAAHNKALNTRYRQRNIMQQPIVNVECAIRQKNT